MQFVMDKVALTQDFSDYLIFPCGIIPPMLHTHSFITDGT
jgi:hypothetical protein